MQDLIHGAPIGRPAANRAYVTAVYADDDGTETHFSRVIQGSASDYRINGRVTFLWILSKQASNSLVHMSDVRAYTKTVIK